MLGLGYVSGYVSVYVSRVCFGGMFRGMFRGCATRILNLSPPKRTNTNIMTKRSPKALFENIDRPRLSRGFGRPAREGGQKTLDGYAVYGSTNHHHHYHHQ